MTRNTFCSVILLKIYKMTNKTNLLLIASKTNKTPFCLLGLVPLEYKNHRIVGANVIQFFNCTTLSPTYQERNVLFKNKNFKFT